MWFYEVLALRGGNEPFDLLFVLGTLLKFAGNFKYQFYMNEISLFIASYLYLNVIISKNNF